MRPYIYCLVVARAKRLDGPAASVVVYTVATNYILIVDWNPPFLSLSFRTDEALEFFADPPMAVREMLRVLKPGGLLMLSNRIGPDLWKLPGRAMPTPQFVARLAALGVQQIETETWMVDYDLVRAIKKEHQH